MQTNENAIARNAENYQKKRRKKNKFWQLVQQRVRPNGWVCVTESVYTKTRYHFVTVFVCIYQYRSRTLLCSSSHSSGDLIFNVFIFVHSFRSSFNAIIMVLLLYLFGYLFEMIYIFHSRIFIQKKPNEPREIIHHILFSHHMAMALEEFTGCFWYSRDLLVASLVKGLFIITIWIQSTGRETFGERFVPED